MARKKKTEIVSTEVQDGKWLYAKDKLPYQIYLEAALVAGNTLGLDPIDQLKLFREMCIKQTVDELTGKYEP